MKSFLVVVLLTNTLIDCIPIERTTEHPDVVNLLIMNSNDSELNEIFQMANDSNSQNNASHPSRMTIPNDVEWIKTNSKIGQQSAFPVVGSVVDMIFAVRMKIF